MAIQTPALTVRGVSKTFPGQKALDGVDMVVGRGEVHALLGENGSGKSTLIKVLAGVHLPDAGGEVDVAGIRLPLGSPTASFEAGLRFVHQKLGVIPEMNAVENIALEAGFRRRGFIDWAAQERLTRALLGRLHVEMDVWKLLRDCRPVERSAVAIARALRTEDENAELSADNVALVVLDEPTSSLPAAEVRQLFRVVRELTSVGIAVIYVSHRLDEVFEIADRVSVLRDGRLRATRDMAGLPRKELVRLIVGRELTNAYQRPARTAIPAAAPATPRLEVTHLAGGPVADVSFSVAPGEIVGFAGVAGSGRELMARTLAGAVTPTGGQITIDGAPLRSITPAATMKAGLMLALGNTQEHSAIGGFSARENLTLGALSRHTRFGQVRRRHEAAEAHTWMEKLDVRPRDPDRLFTLLSGGNQQKVILGKWLSAGPGVLVLDEPTAGVDVGARQSIYGLIGAQAREGLGVVLCSSDLEDLTSLCDRVLILRDGRITVEFSGEDLDEQALLLASVGDTAEQPVPSQGVA